jgi:hypothetical protein
MREELGERLCLPQPRGAGEELPAESEANFRFNN